MKKLFGWLLVILILTVSCIYIFIPSKISISKIIIANAPINSVFRNINQEIKWEKWWRDSDGKPHVKGDSFMYNGSVYRLTKYESNAVGIEIESKDVKLQTELFLVSFSTDSTGMNWQCEIPAGNNPFTRLSKYNQALQLSKNMAGVLQNLKQFFANPKNAYGIDIFKTSTRDTTMLSAKFNSATYPTTAEIYRYIQTLEINIQKQKGKITGLPIMNIRNLDSGGFETQVAIPTNRLLKNEGKTFYRRMVPGNFLSAEVTGGVYTVQEAEKQMNFFAQDFKKSKMAMPFEQLVTNRLNEPDTLKWITRIYLPIAQ